MKIYLLNFDDALLWEGVRGVYKVYIAVTQLGSAGALTV